MSVKKATSLTMKLAQLLEEIAIAEQHGQPFNFGMIRNMLGKRRIILLPCIKSHHEVALPSHKNALDQVRVTVVLEGDEGEGAPLERGDFHMLGSTTLSSLRPSS